MKRKHIIIIAVAAAFLVLFLFVNQSACQSPNPFSIQLSTIESVKNTCDKIELTELTGLTIPAKDNAAVSIKIADMLQKATPYLGAIPKSVHIWGHHTGHFSSIVLDLQTTDGHEITIMPAFYISKSAKGAYYVNIVEALEITVDGKSGYIYSEELFNWFQNGGWRSDFNRPE